MIKETPFIGENVIFVFILKSELYGLQISEYFTLAESTAGGTSL